MKTELITYRTFSDIELANELTDVLNLHQIKYQVESSAGFDPRYMGSATSEYFVKISPDDFGRVNDLLQQNEVENANSVDKDYYLFDFTNDELIDLLSKADEWGAFDITLARKILNDRGIVITNENLKSIKEERINELKKTEPSQTFWVVIGYICAFVGGILGLFIGWHLSSYKKTLPNGEQVFSYNANDRRHGKIIFYIALAMSIILIIARMLFEQ